MTVRKHLLLSAQVVMFCAFLTQIGNAQTPLQTKSDGGVTAQLLDARWSRVDGTEKQLILKYKIIGEQPGTAPVLFNQYRDQYILPWIRDSRDNDTVTASIRGIDPSIQYVYYGLEWLDASAPPDSNGLYRDDALFGDIALPSVMGGSAVVNKTVTTAHGGKLTLKKIKMERVDPQSDEVRIRLVVKLTRPPNILDAQTTVFLTSDTMQKLKKGHSQEPSQEMSTNDEIDKLPGVETFTIRTGISPGQKSISLGFWLIVNANSTRRRDYVHRVLFQIPLLKIPGRTADTPPAPITVAQFGGMQLTLDSLTLGEYRLHSANIWTSDGVSIEDISGSDNLGGKYEGFLDNISRVYWHSNGEPGAVGTRAHVISFHPTTSLAIPKTLSVAITVRPIQRYVHTWEMRSVPLPKIGEILHPKLQAVANDGTKVSISAMQYFDEEHPLAGLDSSVKTGIYPHNGLAIEMELEDNPTLTNNRGRTTALRITNAIDSTGARLDGRGQLTETQHSLITSSKSNSRIVTCLLFAPGSLTDKRTIDLKIFGETIIRTGESQRVVFTNVPEPVATKQ